jgi:hypothetical protein
LPETPKNKEGFSAETENINNRDYSSDIAIKIGKEEYDNIRDIVESSTDKDAKAVWGKFEKDVKIINKNYKHTAHYEDGKGIYFNLAETTKGTAFKTPYQTFFHEAAHNIDYVAAEKGSVGGLSATYNNGAFAKALYADVDSIVVAKDALMKSEFEAAVSTKNIEWFKKHKIFYYDGIKYHKSIAYKEVTRDIRALPKFAQVDVGDIVEGATRGKAGFGHGKSYWDRWARWEKYKKIEPGAGLSAEAFAEMYSATLNNPESLAQIKVYFPNAYKVFLKIIKTMAK